jgi:hypothetical protein
MNSMKREEERDLIRNDNGEWISDEYAVFLAPFDASILETKARQQGKPLSVQHGAGGQLWCYRHELEAIDLTTTGQTMRKLKTNKDEKKD